VSRRHRRAVRRIARFKGSVKLGHARPVDGHHAIAMDGAARRRGQCPKPRAPSGAVGAQRRGIDGAEHSSRIDGVMSALPWCGRRTWRTPAAYTNPCLNAAGPGRERPSGPQRGPRGPSGRGVAHVPLPQQNPIGRGTDRRAKRHPRTTRNFNRTFSKQLVPGSSAPSVSAENREASEERQREEHAPRVPLPLHPSAVPHSE
jgi:hypothetical protein